MSPAADDANPCAPLLARRAALVTAAVAGLLLVVLGAVAIPWSWLPDGKLAVSPGSLFSGAELDRMEEYSSLRRYLGWGSYAVSLVAALLLGLTSWGARITRRLTRGLRWWLVVPLAVLALLLVGRAVTLPFTLVIRERNLGYGLTEQVLADWLADYGKSLLVAWVLTSVLLLVLIGTARLFPSTWFAYAGGLVVALVLGGSFLYPVVVEPLFNQFTPMAAGPFRSSVLELAEGERVAVDEVLVADASRRTTVLNAYVSGFGDTRRVVVYDNLLHELAPAEARSVIAHELAHAKHDDVLVGTMLAALGGVLGVCLLALVLDSRRFRRRTGTRGPGDPASVASILALAALAGVLVSPVQNTVSRAVEARADRDAIVATGGKGFVAMQRQLSLRSLSDPEPPAWSQLWFGTHPTVLQRVGMARSLEAAE